MRYVNVDKLMRKIFDGDGDSDKSWFGSAGNDAKVMRFIDQFYYDNIDSAQMINKQELLNALRERFDDTEYQTYKLFLVIYNIIKDFPEDKGFEGMTNGEVIRALFSYVKIEDTPFTSLIGTDLDTGFVPFLAEWWNAPYKAEGEVNNEDNL